MYCSSWGGGLLAAIDKICGFGELQGYRIFAIINHLISRHSTPQQIPFPEHIIYIYSMRTVTILSAALFAVSTEAFISQSSNTKVSSSLLRAEIGNTGKSALVLFYHEISSYSI